MELESLEKGTERTKRDLPQISTRWRPGHALLLAREAPVELGKLRQSSPMIPEISTVFKSGSLARRGGDASS